MKNKRSENQKLSNKLIIALIILDAALIMLVVKLYKSHNTISSIFSPSNSEERILPDTMMAQRETCDAILWSQFPTTRSLKQRALLTDNTRGKGRLYRVGSYIEEFPDINELQLATAQMFGTAPMQSPDEVAAQRAPDMVYMGLSPYYHVDTLRSSSAYLTPRAQMMLTRIGRNFADSLYVKRIPQSRPIVTSVTRSLADVNQLRKRNRNASDNSCHSYGTTIDISYTRFCPVVRAPGDTIRTAGADTLKCVLGEVLRDLRQSGVCFVKYEKRQSCFHITVR